MFPQPLLIAICAIIPFYLIYIKKNHQWVVAWLAASIVFDIFNSQLYFNLPAILILGMVAIPYLWSERQTFKNNLALKVFGVYLAYLAVLGIYHGFIFPWPDLTGVRSIKDQAQCRAMLHFGRTCCEWLATLYLMVRIEKEERRTLFTFLKSTFICSVILCISALLERTFQLDFYHFFTGGRALLLDNRPRGFDYEPRGLSQSLGYAVLLMPFYPFRKWKYALIPVFLFFAFLYTVSFSGLVVLFSGIVLYSFVFFAKDSHAFAQYRSKVFATFGGIIILTLLIIPFIPEKGRGHIDERFNYLFRSGLAEKFEIADSATINFYIHHPKYFWLGTGPGLVYLPGSAYIIDRDKPIWGNQFNNLPLTGLILILANSGLLGLFLYVSGLIVAIRNRWRGSLNVLLIGFCLSGLYFVQIKYFFVFGFACLLAKSRELKKFHET